MEIQIKIDRFLAKIYNMGCLTDENDLFIHEDLYKKITDIKFIKIFLQDLYKTLSCYKINDKLLILTKETLEKFINNPEKYYVSQKMDFDPKKTYIDFSLFIVYSIMDLILT